ncbi:MAG: copper resistance protein CopC [Candidatus Nitrosocosmicus sp.]
MFSTATFKSVNQLLDRRFSKHNQGHYPSYFMCGFILIISVVCLSLTASYFIPEVYGHAFVISTNPSSGQTLDESPGEVVADINEPVDLTYSKISVVNSNGERVDNADLTYVDNDESKLSVTVPAELGEDTYIVSVQMLSQIDGHLTQDTFVFGIGKQGMVLSTSDTHSEKTPIFDQLSVGSAIARFPALVGQVMIVGSAFCMLWLWKPITRIKWLGENFLQLRKKIENKALLLLLTGSIILLVSDFAMIVSLAISINASIIDAINTKFGDVWLVRTILSLSILFFVLFVLYRRKKESLSNSYDNHKKERIIEYLVIFVAGIATLLTTSLMGHASAVSSNFFYIMLDFIHNIAASLWIGGVIYLAFVAIPSLKDNYLHDETRNVSGIRKLKLEKIIFPRKVMKEEKADSKDNYDPFNTILLNSIISIIIPRFSFIPVIILGTILLTGPFLLYVLEDNLSLTLASLYGKVLVTKLILAGVMIIMGAYYQIVIHNQSMLNIAQYASLGTSQDQKVSKSEKPRTYSVKKILSRFNRGLKAEVFFGILLLGSVAILTSTGLPESEEGIQASQPVQNELSFVSNSDQPPYHNTAFISNDGIDDFEPDNNDIRGNNPVATTNISNTYTKVLLSIEPYLPGNNNLKVSFLDPYNNPVDFDQVKLKMTFVEESTSPISVNFAPIGVSTTKESVGVFSANTTFGFTGHWQIEVEGISSEKNMSNIYAVFDVFVKPSLDQMRFNITEFKTSIENISGASSNQSQPLYPVYDQNRNVIWTGDTVLNSGRILEFDLDNTNYIEHKINGTRIISQLALDSNDNIWYLDPLNRLLGFYNPQNSSNENYLLFSQSPVTNSINNQERDSNSSNSSPPLSSYLASEAQGAPSALAIDSKGKVWITIANTNIILKFDPITKSFEKIQLPSSNANPLSIVFDRQDVAWIAEGGSSSIAKVTTQAGNHTIREFYPNGTGSTQLRNESLKDPIFITTSPFSDEIFISEHEGNAISVFDPVTETFRQLPLDSKEALPFGMVFDKYRNLWIAEHLTNRITVMDPITGEQKGVEIPTPNPFVQYLTVDRTGQVWFAEQRGNALARIDTSIDSMPLLSQPSTAQDSVDRIGILDFTAEIGFEKIAAPLIALGIIIVSIMYIRTTNVFYDSIQYVEKIQKHNIEG